MAWWVGWWCSHSFPSLCDGQAWWMVSSELALNGIAIWTGLLVKSLWKNKAPSLIHSSKRYNVVDVNFTTHIVHLETLPAILLRILEQLCVGLPSPRQGIGSGSGSHHWISPVWAWSSPLFPVSAPSPPLPSPKMHLPVTVAAGALVAPLLSAESGH